MMAKAAAPMAREQIVRPGDGPPATFVVGTGRCGSSAVAKILRDAGLPMGQKMLEGTWEDTTLHAIDRGLAQQLNWGWDHIPAMARDLQRFDKLTKSDACEQYRAWIELRAAEPAAQWGWGAKSPALGLVYGEIQHLLPRHQLIVVDRRADATIRSMAEKENIDLPEAQALYQWMLMRIQVAVHDAWWARVPVHRVQYEALLDNPAPVVDDLLRKVLAFSPGLDLNFVAGVAAITPRTRESYLKVEA